MTPEPMRMRLLPPNRISGVMFTSIGRELFRRVTGYRSRPLMMTNRDEFTSSVSTRSQTSFPSCFFGIVMSR